MLDVLLKNKFYRKCKSAIKLTKLRIEIIKRKRNATQKYLKKDVTDLLKNGLDKNAYSRAEGLLVELNLTRCYDFTNKLCDHILKNLSVMSKQRECPEECKEAVSSLIFAAARLAHLHELRHLRSIFTERYGNAFDCYASNEFVEKLKLAHPMKDATLQLMQDIATQTGVHWDSKATEEKLYNPPPTLGQVKSNVADKFQTSEKPKDGKLSNITNTPQQRNYLKVTQEDIIRGRKEQETTSYVPECKKTFNCNPISHTKSKTRDTRNKDEGQLRVDIIDDVSISDAGSTTLSAKKYDLEHENKVKYHTLLDEYQPDEEERLLDRLLMHYSSKKAKPSNRKENTEPTKLPLEQDNFKMTRKGTSRDFCATRAALSFNAEQNIESKRTNRKEYILSTSFQPEMLKGGHVHPKLPDDYDDFLAHLAAIREGWK